MSSLQVQNNMHSLQESIDKTYTFPTSFAQQRLWFLDRLLGSSSLYNNTWGVQIYGKLDVSAVKQSLNEIFARHEVMRTCFIERDGDPVQVIRTSVPFECTLMELSALPQENRDSEIQAIIDAEANKPFDLKQAPLIRALLLKLSEQEHILLIVIHHIVSDGWSMGVFMQELASLYRSFSQGQSANLPELPIQYADYAVWQRDWLQGEVLERQLSYWKTQLADLTLLELPTDKPRPKQQSYRGARAAVQLSAALTQGLKTLSQQQNVTLFMTLLAALKVLFHRYSGQDDIVVGTAIAGRNRQEVENLIGFFVNTLALRTDLSGTPTFRQLLSRVSEVCLSAYAHQDLPFEKLVAELNPQRDMSRNPFFDVLVNQFNRPIKPLDLKNLDTHSIEQADILAKFSLTLYISVNDETINLEVVYQDELFSAERITSLLEQYQYLLEQIIISPDTVISKYSLVTANARPLLPDPAIDILDVPQILVKDSFLQWANRAPDNIALCLNEQQWTYRDLADSSIKLAYELKNIGLEKGHVVGITGAPSFGLIATIIGVFLSGGVILTIDEQLPIKRKQSMLSASSAKILCLIGDNSNLLNDIDDLQELITLNVNPQTASLKNADISSGHGNTELPEIWGDDSAYIFFTSGSTGVPKGVLGCHKGLSHFINWQREQFKIDQNDRVAQLTNLSFDVFLRDLFLPLTSGATLCLPEARDVLDTVSWLNRENISIVHSVPSIFRSWLERQSDTIKPQKLRYLFSAGEPLTDGLINNWRQTFPHCGQIINLYGPTETTLAKLFYVVPDSASNGIQPIGQAIPQTQALILNEADVLCGVGEIGQIVIRTPFRSLGYINLPEQTRLAFRKSPFSNDERDIVYYTGDLGRYRSNGLVEILGRVDNQVKIRGVRIEPEEITAILDKHDAVSSSVVIAVKGAERNYLLGYVVPEKNASVTVSDIRNYLAGQLPPVMIPEQFVFLDKMPLKPNGKIDRGALPAPDQTRPEFEQSYIPPRTPNEERLVTIWQEVLNIAQIGIHDNFFELGGHSLLAVSLLSQVNSEFHTDLPLVTVFNFQTVAQMAELLSTQEVPASFFSLFQIQKEGSKPPLVWIQHHADNGVIKHIGKDQPIYCLHLGIGAPPGSTITPLGIKPLARHYIEELLMVQPKGPYFLIGHCWGGLIAFEMAQQLIARQESVPLLFMVDTYVPDAVKALPFRQQLSNIMSLTPNEFTNKFFKNLKRVNRKVAKYIRGTTYRPEVWDRDIMHPVVKAYKPKAYSGRVILFTANQRIHLRAHAEPAEFGWRKFIGERLTVHEIPVGHREMIHSQSGKQIAHIITEAMHDILNNDS